MRCGSWTHDAPVSADVTAGDKALTLFNNLQHTTFRAASRTMCSNRTDLSDLPSLPATALLSNYFHQFSCGGY